MLESMIRLGHKRLGPDNSGIAEITGLTSKTANCADVEIPGAFFFPRLYLYPWWIGDTHGQPTHRRRQAGI